MIVVFRWPPGKNKFFRSDILQGKFLFKRFYPFTHNLEHLQKIKKKKVDGGKLNGIPYVQFWARGCIPQQ